MGEAPGPIIVGLLVGGFGWQSAGPMVRVFIAPILVYGAFLGLSEAAHVLMEGTLAHVDVGSSRDDIEAIDHVDSVHEIHA